MSNCFGTDQSPDAFGAWAKKRDVFLHPDVAFLVPTKTMGFGVFARKPLKAGTVVVSCPFVTCISPYEKTSLDSPCLKALTELQIKDNVLYVVLRLMAEAVRHSSPWMPWLKACPRMSDHFFDESTAKVVFGLSSSGASATPTTSVSLSWTGPSQQLREIKVAQRWEAAQEVMRRFPEYWPEEQATFSLFCECLAQVLSRNFHREEIEGREGPYLLPGLDIINHSSAANGKFEIRGGGRKHALTFCVVAARELRRGEQVFCTYGRIGASRFAIEFQFVTKTILEEDMLRFSLDVIAEMTVNLIAAEESSSSTAKDKGMIQERLEWLQRLGFLFDEGFYVSRLPPPSGGEVPAATAKEVETLFNVFYLMTVEPVKFENLIHTINREWCVERTPKVLALVSRVLAMRAEAVRLQMAVSEANLAETVYDARRKLLEMTLASELEMIHLLQQHIGESH